MSTDGWYGSLTQSMAIALGELFHIAQPPAHGEAAT
jgi:hypothetical protein